MDGMVQPEDGTTIATKLAGGKTQKERKVPLVIGTGFVVEMMKMR